MCLRGPGGSSAPACLQAQPVLLPGALCRSIRLEGELLSEPQSTGSLRALSPGLESGHVVEVVLLVLSGGVGVGILFYRHEVRIRRNNEQVLLDQKVTKCLKVLWWVSTSGAKGQCVASGATD